MRRTKRLTFMIVVIPLLSMMAGTVAFVVSLGRTALSNLPELVTEIASERIKGTVSIGDIDVQSGTGIEIRDVVIADDVSNETVVRIPRVRIAYKLSDIVLRRTAPAESIKSIEIVEPEIILRRAADGSWNVADMLKPSAPGKPIRFDSKIYVRSGKLIMLDCTRDPDKPVENVLSSINAAVDLSDMPVAKYKISGKGEPGKLGRFAVEGRYNLSSHSFNADLDMLNVSAAHWTTYPLDLGLNVTSGKARVGIRLSKESKDGPLRYTGLARLRSAAVQFRQIRSPAREVNGDVEFRNGVVSLDLNGRLESSPFSVSGQVHTSKPGRLALEIDSSRLNLRQVAALTGYSKSFAGVTLPERARAKINVTGTTSAPRVAFSLDAPSFTYQGITAESVAAEGSYAGGKLTVSRASAKAMGGSLEVRGEVNTQGGTRALLVGNVTDADLSRLPQIEGYPVTGTSSGKLRLSWQPKNLSVSYQGTIAGARYEDLHFDGTRVDATYSNGDVQIRELSTKTFGGLMAASGEIGADGALRLKVAGSDVNVAAIRDMFWEAPTVGRAHFAGDITGTLEAPAFEGDIEVQRLMVSGFGIQRIAGTVSANPNEVELEDLTVYDPAGEVVISGKVSDISGEDPVLDLTASTDGMATDRFSAMLGQWSLPGGTAAVDIAVKGRLSAPQADGTFRMEGGSFQEIDLDTVEAEVAYDSNSLHVSDARVTFGQTTLTASGDMSLDGDMSIAFAGDRIDLAMISPMVHPYASVSGLLSVSGKAEGGLESPSVTASLSSEKPTINGLAFQKLSGDVSWQNRSFEVGNLSLTDGSSEYNIPRMAYDLDARKMSVSAELTNIEARCILAMLSGSPAARSKSGKLNDILKSLPKPLAGTINATASGAMVFTDDGVEPDLTAGLSLSDVKIGTSTIASVETEAYWQDGTVGIENLQAIDGDTNLAAEASLGPAGELSAQVDAHNLSSDILKQWTDLSDNFSGNADVTIVAGGTISSPTVEASVEVVEPQIGKAKFDRLRTRFSADANAVGQSADARGKIYVNDLTLVFGDHKVTASGYIPVDWSKPTIPMDGPIMLEAKLDTGSLELLSAFTGIKAESGPEGSLEGSIRLEGTVQSPSLAGNLLWRDGQIAQLPMINEALQNIQARISLAGDQVTIDKLTGESSAGGSFSVSGQVALAQMEPVFDLQVATKGLSISGKDFSNQYGEEVAAALDSQLSVKGDFLTPTLAGMVKIPQAETAVWPKDIRPAATLAKKPPIDPRFDIKASLGSDVQFRSTRVKSPVRGDLMVKGSLSTPILEGDLDISGASILFPLTEFRTQPGSVVRLNYGPSREPAVYIEVEAQARLTATSYLGERQRYTVTMTVEGPMDNLQSSFSSSPPGLDDNRIFALVTGQQQLERILTGNAGGDIGKEISGLFSTAVMPTVFDPIEEAFRQALGFDDFSLEVGYDEPMRLSVSDRLFDSLYLDYTAVLGARPDYADSSNEIKLSYRFKHGIELGVSMDDNREISVGVGGKLRF